MAGTPNARPLKACSSCGSTEVARVTRLATGGGAGGGTYLALRWGLWGEPIGRVEAEICKKCGHMDLFLADTKALHP